MTKTLAAAVLAFSMSFSSIAVAAEQPHMKAALESLRQAKEQLEKATPDKGGHRVKALKAINEAIEQTEKGIAFDNKN